MAFRSLAAGFVVLSILVSACVGGSDEPTARSATTSAPPPTVSADTGSIAGSIMNDEQAPVPGVEVGLIEDATRKASTDQAGRFTLNEIPPGSYTLVAQRLGFNSAAKSITVVAGEVTEVTFILSALRVVEAYQESFVYDGFFSCGASSPVVTAACRGNVDVQDRTRFSTNVSAGVKTFIDAMTWQSSAPLTAKVFRNVLTVASPGSGSGQTSGPSPNIVRLDEPKTKDGTVVNHLIWIGFTSTSEPVVVVYQQKFNILTSVFYGQEAPEDYTGLTE